MAVFTVDHRDPGAGDPTSDQCATAMLPESGKCAVCGEDFRQGERAWYYVFGHGEIAAHVACIKSYARGVILDFAGMMK